MSISLKYLLRGVTGVVEKSVPDVELSGMTLDSREVVEGSVFVALKGLNAHGLAYAASAEQSGAVAILWEYDETVDVAELKIPLIAIKELPASLGGIAARLYDYSSQALQIVGITGTDGKTSVSHFLAQAMNASDESCSVIGTLGIGNPSALEKATHTTPDVISVHKNLQRLSTRGSRCVAMEVSSHALDQQRVAGVNFDVAVLTNLTRDHLDYHGTAEAYADAKAKLFLECQPKAAVVNLNDEFGVKIAESLKQAATVLCGYAIGDPENFTQETLVASNAQFDHLGLRADITFLGKKYQLQAAVLGDFNLSNLLAAAGSLIALGYVPEKALEMVGKVSTVPGRIEKIELKQNAKQDFLAVVDYAHTPGALESVLNALRVHCSNRLICIFGCGGDRDKGKRPLMAAVAERLADVVVVTDDNPRFEDPQQIMQDIVNGFSNPDLASTEHDRAVAINSAIAMANKGDVVLVAGKGHEQSQLIQGKALPFDDCEQIRLALTKLAERVAA